MSLGWAQAIVLLVAVQRIGELWLAQRNTRRLLAAGGIESGARHYPLIIVVHVGWLVALFLTVPPDRAPLWPLLVLFLMLQVGRIWVIATLGRFWTTRVVSLPGAPLIRRGPYRFVRHPNYLIVASEIAVLPLAFGAWILALVFTALNAAVLFHRIRVEDAALASRRKEPSREPSTADH